MAAAANRKDGKSPKKAGDPPSLKEAIEDAAEKYGRGTHEVKVEEISATVDVRNPGEVREYRVVVSE
jgi:hypothetical protein